MKLVIYLSSEGDCFQVKRYSGTQSPSLESVTPEEARLIHPVISQIALAKNKIEVSQALYALKAIAEKDTKTITSYFFREGKEINNYDNFVIKADQGEESDVQFSLFHTHGPYIGHSDIKGRAHRDSFEKMIGFVEGSNRQADDGLSSYTGCLFL